MAVPRVRPGAYPALFSYGFRPFFLFGSIWGGLVILVWLPLLSGHISTASAFSLIDWHAHELIFGFLPAIVTGFLLTAIPNWTGRLPLQGMPLAALVSIWVAGRLAISTSAIIGWLPAMLIDCAFLATLVAAMAREIIAGRNWRNLKVIVPVCVLTLANALFHLEARIAGSTDIARRLGLSVGVVLIMIIGGRIIPSFTRNWLVKRGPGRLPAPFGRFDGIAILGGAGALAAWTFAPDAWATGTLLLTAGLLSLARLARWAGDRTLANPLLLVLHAAFLFVPLGFIAAGLVALCPELFPPASGIHVFGVGAIGAMSLAVMARATLGHTGRPLRADTASGLIFAAILLAAPFRFAAVLAPDQPYLLHISAGLWVLAFLAFALHYGVMLVRPKLSARSPNAPPAARGAPLEKPGR